MALTDCGVRSERMPADPREVVEIWFAEWSDPHGVDSSGFCN